MQIAEETEDGEPGEAKGVKAEEVGPDEAPKMSKGLIIDRIVAQEEEEKREREKVKTEL